METDFNPLQDWLLVKLHEVEKQTETGFAVADKKLTPNKATVMKAAEKAISNVGDTIFVEKLNLHEIKLDGELYHAIQERYVIGIVPKQ